MNKLWQWALFGLFFCLLPARAADLALPNAPLFVPAQNIPPLVMLVMGRDHTLYYEAYNDATDLDGDGVLDTHFKSSITYYGYFDSSKCYAYESAIFVPKSVVSNGSCSKSTGRWHGNFLNYLTTSRMDALRKVLYGGLRRSSTSASTVLERAYIPQDAHSWGKTWNPAIMKAEGMKISDFAPYDDNKGYLFANTSLMSDTSTPLLRVQELDEYMSHGFPAVTSVALRSNMTGWDHDTLLTSIGGNRWQLDLTVAESSSSDPNRFKFYIKDTANSGGLWYGYNKIIANPARAVAISDSSSVDIPIGIGKKSIFFNDRTRRFVVLDQSDVSESAIAQIDARIYIWDWVSKERPVAGDDIDNFFGDKNIKNFTVRVKTCVEGLRESNCQKYEGGGYYPVGLLQKKGGGDNPDMYFGLISGSYKNNTKGGVLRAKIGKMDDEVDKSTGQFKTRDGTTDGPGIISTLNKLKITNFLNDSGHFYSYACGWVTNRAINNGECSAWGNPIAEMLYESLRYFAGAKTPTSSFTTVGSSDELSLPEDSWNDPFATEGGFPYCAQPYQLVISDVGTSYDSDQLPGSSFPTNPAFVAQLPGSMTGLNVSDQTKTISNSEGVNGNSFFIGEVLNQTNAGLPTAKTITNLAEVRGLSPMEPTKQGSYYAAGLAYYGYKTDINPATGGQKPKTIVVAMASNLPEVLIRTPKGVVSLIPFAKSVKDHKDDTIDGAFGKFQPTNGIVDFYVEKITPTEGSFRVNFEDVEQGADHDMDMIVLYQYKVQADGTLNITLTSEYSGGTIEQHAGYVISGTTRDGVYLDVYDIDTDPLTRTAYYMDTPLADDQPYPYNSRSVGSNRTVAMPLVRTRTFSADDTKTAASFLPSPLWYAAKWGSFDDKNKNGIPDSGEWDSKVSGQPDNYFLVTNPTNLEDQLKDAMDRIGDNNRSGTSISYPSSDLSSASLAYRAGFEAKYWSGDIKAYAISNGVMATTPAWSANDVISKQSPAARAIFTMDSDGNKRQFAIPASESGATTGLSSNQISALMQSYPSTAGESDRVAYLQALVGYLRGDRTYEVEGSKVPGINQAFRERKGVLGDIVHSTPVYGVSAGDKQPFLVFGANDGMVHVLNADTGAELLAYIPSTAYGKLASLASTGYSHRYFVDGTIKVVNVGSGSSARTLAIGTFGLGGQGAWALDLTNIKSVDTSAPDKYLLWELTDKASSKVGYIPAAPALLSGTDSQGNASLLAVFGNGYNTTESDGHVDASGMGALLVVNGLDGTLLRTLDTGAGSAQDPVSGSSRPNAVGEPVFSDWDRDGKADRLYAGDLFGNLWAVDVSSGDVATWKILQNSSGNTIPLFTARSADGSAQPISARPSVAYHPLYGALVLFGTGKYLETSDLDVSNQATQSIYAIWDRPDRHATLSRNTLLAQTLASQAGSPAKRTTSTNAINWLQHNGWYLDLYVNGSNHGERVVTKILVRNTIAAITSMIPNSDICTGGGSGWYMEVNLYEGHNRDLVDRSDELENIPSDPVFTFHTDKDGDVKQETKVQEDGGEVHTPPAVTERTALGSWQQLY